MTERKIGEILLVEDDSSLRRAVSLKLTREGYEVHTAETLKEAWEICSTRSLALIICDRLHDSVRAVLLHRILQRMREDALRHGAGHSRSVFRAYTFCVSSEQTERRNALPYRACDAGFIDGAGDTLSDTVFADKKQKR